ncbi:hypothetical protein GCM10025883_29210 [Mobilicoccus caccae]|uniref:Uncharacterized protein n=1 Tax=Mobilicoccus caccae TaxID=1859295 RepID=A0ABQ6IUY2_9MICO|nr:hypothetical protein GCM10025883_29210 [Mobilicoccus caccae]
MVRGVSGSILYGIVGGTALAIAVEAVMHVGSQTDATGKIVNPTGWGLNVPQVPTNVFDMPDLGLLGQFNLLGSFQNIGIVAACLLIFTLMLADFFDTMGTMVAIGAEADLLDEDGNPPTANASSSSTPSPPSPAAWAASAATPPTSNPPPASAKAPAPDSPASSPAHSSSPRCSSHPSSPSSPTKPPHPPSSSSASS